MIAQELTAAVVRHRRVIRAKEQLALVRAGQRFGHVKIDAKAAAARLFVEVRETEGGNVVKDAHLLWAA